MDTPTDHEEIRAAALGKDHDVGRTPREVIEHLAEVDHDDGALWIAPDDVRVALVRLANDDGDVAEALGYLGIVEAQEIYTARRRDLVLEERADT